MSPRLNEDTLSEQPSLDWLKGLGYDIAFGPDLAPGGAFQERDDFRSVILQTRLIRSLRRLNPNLSDAALDQAVYELTLASEQPQLMSANKCIYELITRGIPVTMRDDEGKEQVRQVTVIDYSEPLNNEFLAVNQFAIQGAERVRRADVVVFVNGLPLAIFEVKSPTSQGGTVDSAIRQLDDYKRDIPALFGFNQVLVASDLLHAMHGTISSTREWFAEWKFVDDEGEKRQANLETLIAGIFHKQRFLDIVQNFIVFEADSDEDSATFTKKMCKYHQYYGVNRTIARTVKAMRPRGSKKIGVFWHTQGSGKTLSMVFYVNKLRHITELRSPTLIFLTDRQNLDDQLFKTFKRTGYSALTKHMENIRELKEKLRSPGAELIFTTIQKFEDGQELLSENDNIILIADEAHRSQYKALASNIRDALPNASFLGITGTPISFSDRDTRLVFGDLTTVYRIDQSVADQSTVPLFYEGRLVPLNLRNLDIDQAANALMAGESNTTIDEATKKKLIRLDSAVGAPERLEKIAEDVVNHFTHRGIEGKGMVVTINRKVAVELYKRIIAQKNAPKTAVVVSNLEEYRGQVQQELSVSELERQFKNPRDHLQLVIVCDMWLTGFDVPPLHTMYIDKPLKGHTLMQAIARANRVYKDKPSGLIVDYIGIAGELKKALSLYSSDIRDKGVFPIEEAIIMMQEKHRIVSGFFGEVRWQSWKKLKGQELAVVFQSAVSAVLGENDTIDEERKQRYIEESTKLEKLHALVTPHAAANAIRDDVMFFQAVKQALYKSIIIVGPTGGMPPETETALKKLIAESFGAEGVIDLFAAEGKAIPEISIFDERFLAEVKKMRMKNLAIETMRKLLRDELHGRLRMNRARYEPLRALLEELIEKYENNIISSAEVIEKLIELARQIKDYTSVGAKLGLSDDEVAFFDALSEGKKVIKDDARLKQVVHELVSMIRRDATIDWTNNDVIQARIRANVRLLLLRNGYATEEMPSIVERILEQAKTLFADVIANNGSEYAKQ